MTDPDRATLLRALEILSVEPPGPDLPAGDLEAAAGAVKDVLLGLGLRRDPGGDGYTFDPPSATTTTHAPAFYGDGEPDWLPRRVVQARLGLSESRTIELISDLGRFHSWRQTERGALEVAACCVEAEAGGELCARCCGEDGERCARGHRP